MMWKREQHPLYQVTAEHKLPWSHQTLDIWKIYPQKPQTSLHLPVNTLESSWRKVSPGKSRVPWVHSHATTKWQDHNKSAPEGMSTDRVSSRYKAEPQTCFRKTKEQFAGNKKLSLTCYIAGFKDIVYKRRLEVDLYQVCISIAPRGLVLNSRHWDLSQKVFMAPSLFAFH